MKYILLFAGMIVTSILACKKTEYSFGNIKTPSNLSITAAIQGASTSSPAGDGSGNVTITASATNALTYKIYFGNGDSVLTSTGTASYKYTTLDTNTYTITVNAIGTGGAMSTMSKQIKVLYTYQIPSNVMAALTNGTTKNWIIAKDTVGHFGVGPSNTFSADWYKAQPNEKPSCAYGGVITFAQAGSNSITVNVNNQGSSFLIGAATSFYGQSGGDGCYPISTGGTKTLGFSTSNSGSNSSNSTGIQFTVPGNGIIGFGTGATVYEILSLSPTVMALRNIGSDGNAWYQILRAQ
ncbi:MAG: PKD domain-containing protein [Bacteroidota bacterium]|nr:PKD domain-containing protein [Bacteroidota bacterium]